MGEAAGTRQDSRGAPAPDGAGADDLVVQVVDLPPDAALDAPELETLGFRPLATCAIGPVGVDPVPTRVHCARYGDAYAFADPLDADVRLRVLTVLSSGRIVETRVLADRRHAGTVFDALVEAADRARLAVRYPDRAAEGVHRQRVDVADLTTLWISHRGFVRKVQGGDDVVDHASVDLFAQVMRRSWAARVRLDRPEMARVDLVLAVVRGVLLFLPCLAGLLVGFSVLSAVVAAGVPALLALLARDAVRSKPWRPWLLLVPLAAAVVGGVMLSIGATLGVLAFDLAAIGVVEFYGPVVVQGALRALGPVGTLPPPSPPG